MSLPDALGEVTVYPLGQVEYADGLALQALFGRARKEGLVKDSLLLLEHPPVLTLGRGAKPENILVSDAQLEAEGVERFETNRGGDVTYHGPGQLVGYPILALPKARQDVRRYVRDLEEVLIRTVARFGISAQRVSKWPGVWVGSEALPPPRKIAALGVHLSRWQTSHGFALNVNTHLPHFELIIPCGIQSAGVTSMQQALGVEVPLGEVQQVLCEGFADVFGARVSVDSQRMRTVSVTVMRRREGRWEVLVLERTVERVGFLQVVTGRIEAGESAAQAAQREAYEELGAMLEPVNLDYVHAFGLGDAVPPVLVEETAFAALWPSDAEPKLGPEHVRFEWVPVPEALLRLPFAGFKAALRRAVKTLTGG